jgi:hypothetical protein
VFLSNWKYGGGAPSVFVVAPSCYDLWFPGRSMPVLYFEFKYRSGVSLLGGS